MDPKLLKHKQHLQNRQLVFSWLGTCILVGCMIWVTITNLSGRPILPIGIFQRSENFVNDPSRGQFFSKDILPVFSKEDSYNSIRRNTLLQTNMDPNQRHEVTRYIVEKGDSIFKISTKFNVSPETILWANYETLNDNPELLTIGMNLDILPTDGIYYQWGADDTIEDVAIKYKVEASAILLWPENRLDLNNPLIEDGTYVMIPGGKREMVSWVMPTIPRKNSGVTKTMAGPGACETVDGAYGTGTFVWPAVNNYLSGNDYWSGHLALDIASGLGSPVYASDSGLVVYAGWNNSGYGYMVMIDHGNGYQTLYAHLSQISVTCGSSVYQGSPIGSSGSTGNSTGPHLHFETRYLGGLVNPWSLLP